jgi:hypothetical protein
MAAPFNFDKARIFTRTLAGLAAPFIISPVAGLPIATKIGLDWSNGQPFRNATPARIFAEIEASLNRLRTDVIDIYQVH